MLKTYRLKRHCEGPKRPKSTCPAGRQSPKVGAEQCPVPASLFVMTKRGQNLTEIALIIGIVGLVLIGMEVYARRGIQSKVKDLTDNMIGKEQAIYQQDTSGLAVDKSESASSSSSTAVISERQGGSKTVVIPNEQSKTVYTYESGS